MMEMCQVVIRQCEGYTQHKPEVVDYYEPFHNFLRNFLGNVSATLSKKILDVHPRSDCTEFHGIGPIE